MVITWRVCVVDKDSLESFSSEPGRGAHECSCRQSCFWPTRTRTTFLLRWTARKRQVLMPQNLQNLVWALIEMLVLSDRGAQLMSPKFLPILVTDLCKAWPLAVTDVRDQTSTFTPCYLKVLCRNFPSLFDIDAASSSPHTPLLLFPHDECWQVKQQLL